MANAFGIISALVLAAAAYFGFMNKKALADQRLNLSDEESRLQRNEKTFDDKKADLLAEETARDEADVENADLTENLETQLATNKKLQSDIDDSKSSAESKKGRVEEGREKLAKLGGLENLKHKLEKLGTDLAIVNGDLELKNTEIITRTALNDSLGTENVALEGVLGRYASRKSEPSLNARVTRVVSDLDFVILSGGDSAGIVRDSMLNVQRGGVTIGKLKVTGTEPSTAAADVVPDSFEDGVRVRVGDTVVAAN